MSVVIVKIAFVSVIVWLWRRCICCYCENCFCLVLLCGSGEDVSVVIVKIAFV